MKQPRKGQGRKQLRPLNLKPLSADQALQAAMQVPPPKRSPKKKKRG